MINKIKKLFNIFLLLFIGSIIGYILGNYNAISHSSIKHINSILYDMDIEMDMLEHWSQKYRDDSFIEEKLKQSIFHKILLLSKENPSIDDLQGVPLQALYRQIFYKQNNTLSFGKHDDVFRIINVYLDKIEADVIARVKRKQLTLKRELKNLGDPLREDRNDHK